MSAEPNPPAPPKRSGVEITKENSRYLRGSIADDLAGAVDHFGEGDKNLLKFHGTYQQEDRDARKNRAQTGVRKHYMFMVRCKIPGGKLNAAQYLAVDDLAGQFANGTLRFTSRQGIQLHGVLKGDLKSTIAAINECLLTTLGACGDVERNVMACPAPDHTNSVRAHLQRDADQIAAHLAPRTRSYHDIWLNGQNVTRDPLSVARDLDSSRTTDHESRTTTDEEPIYGKLYLPRKFKTGLALPEDNCIDVYAQDLGFLADVQNGQVIGYDVLVGGGMGMTHGNDSTFPHVARPICYIAAEELLPTAEAVVKLFRDHGNRADRKRARIKYLVHDWGVERFREVLTPYLGRALTLPKGLSVSGFETHLGWQPQGDGKFYYGVSVENGRVKDDGSFRLRSALRLLMERLKPTVRLTALQDVLLCDLPVGARGDIEMVLRDHGVIVPQELSLVQTLSLACPAIPTCGLAISESERALPGIIDELEARLKELGLEGEAISVRMTGCPNGCVRPYQSDIGIVGRTGDKYTLFVGGHVLGHRLNFELADLVPRGRLVPLLVPLLTTFKQTRVNGESFGDFCQRLGADSLRALLPEEVRADRHD